MSVEAFIRQQIQEYPVLLYIKGTPERPQCGFSKKALDILNQCEVAFQSVDVLSPDIRATLKEVSDWPTIPQLYIKGELIGGSDIMENLYHSGALQRKLNEVMTK